MQNGYILPGIGLVTVRNGVGVVSVGSDEILPCVSVISVTGFSEIVVNGTGLIFVGSDEILSYVSVISVSGFSEIVVDGAGVIFVG